MCLNTLFQLSRKFIFIYIYTYIICVIIIYYCCVLPQKTARLASQSGVNPSPQSLADLCLGLSPDGWYFVTVVKEPLFKVPPQTVLHPGPHSSQEWTYSHQYIPSTHWEYKKLTGPFNDLQVEHAFYEVN